MPETYAYVYVKSTIVDVCMQNIVVVVWLFTMDVTFSSRTLGESSHASVISYNYLSHPLGSGLACRHAVGDFYLISCFAEDARCVRVSVFTFQHRVHTQPVP